MADNARGGVGPRVALCGALLALGGCPAARSTSSSNASTPRTAPTLAVAPGPVAPAAPTAPVRLYDQVVIVSFDGMRPDAMEQALAPTLHRLRAEGAYAADAQTINMSSTLPSHSSMLTGVDVDVHGMDFDEFRPGRGYVRATTVFQDARRAGFATAMFVSKSKLRHIATPGSLDVWSLPSHGCDGVSTAAARYLATAPAGLTFVHFGEPDVAGHHRGWMSPDYFAAITRADRCLALLMDAVAARTDRVLVIASADHGGHSYHHGTTEAVDLHIPWIAWGLHVHTGTFPQPVRTIDTAATALAALGITASGSTPARPVAAALDADLTSDPRRLSPGRWRTPLHSTHRAHSEAPAHRRHRL